MMERSYDNGHWNRLVVICVAILLVMFSRSCTPREAHAQEVITTCLQPDCPTSLTVPVFTGPQWNIYADRTTTTLKFERDGVTALQISKDGQVTFQNGIEPTESTKKFAEMLQQYFDVCRSQETK